MALREFSGIYLMLMIIFLVSYSTEAAPVQIQLANYEWPFPKKLNPTGKTKFTLGLLKTKEYHVDIPKEVPFDSNGTGTVSLDIVGPPGEIILQVRRTKVSWDNRTIYASGFVNQPTVRGTVGIILSCTFTLFLCVWTAFHANIELAKETREDDKWYHQTWRKITGTWWRKFGWSVVVIIFPEAALFFAVFERRTAKRLCKKIDEALAIENSFDQDGKRLFNLQNSCNENNDKIIVNVRYCPSITDSPTSSTSLNPTSSRKKFGPYESLMNDKKPREKLQWSRNRELGYFALMGGFAIRNPTTDKLDVLTPQGVYYVCRHLDPAYELVRIVDDKNSASLLAKSLVVFQVLRIIVQIIFRYKANLSVTLLETHTVIHAGCALWTYGLWLKKPFNVKHPIELHLDQTIVDLLYKQKDEGQGSLYDDCEEDPINILNPVKRNYKFKPLAVTPYKCVLKSTHSPRTPSLQGSSTPGSFQNRSPSHDISRTDPNQNWYTVSENRPTLSSYSSNSTLQSNEESMRLIEDEIRQLPELRIPLLTTRAGQTKLASRMLSGGQCRRPHKNLPGLLWAIYRRLCNNIWRIWKECIFMAAASILYGGLHAWAYIEGHFPTEFEKQGWFIAMIATASSGLGCVLVLIIGAKMSGSSDSSTSALRRIKRWYSRIQSWLFMVLCLLALLVSIAGRGILVVESFASMRDPSAKAFRIVSWTNMAVI
ncbi:hypothetical protein EDC01DRAFT_712539 [Geopyxis carbonaria]|nr:hypothetical protein EDC01DRAFT_712539 [Geopyxis carbonaria]